MQVQCIKRGSVVYWAYCKQHAHNVFEEKVTINNCWCTPGSWTFPKTETRTVLLRVLGSAECMPTICHNESQSRCQSNLFCFDFLRTLRGRCSWWESVQSPEWDISCRITYAQTAEGFIPLDGALKKKKTGKKYGGGSAIVRWLPRVWLSLRWVSRIYIYFFLKHKRRYREKSLISLYRRVRILCACNHIFFFFLIVNIIGYEVW